MIYYFGTVYGRHLYPPEAGRVPFQVEGGRRVTPVRPRAIRDLVSCICDGVRMDSKIVLGVLVD